MREKINTSINGRRKWSAQMLVALATLAIMIFPGCQPEEIVYDHEQPQFEVRTNAILIELIVPSGTAIDDDIYIYGAFNGEDDNSVVDQLAWKMEKAQYSDKKWGIYLFPNDFKDGKTLADGFSFVSMKSGAERDINGQPVVHTLNATVGTRYNVWADRWAAYFSNEDDNKVTHDGYVVYVIDQSGFGDLMLYMYGDVNDLNGGWPGMKPTGTETLNGVEYVYFDMGADNNGLSETLIFSDNGANQLADYGPVTFNGDNLFLRINEDGSIENIDAPATIEHDGPVVYVLDGKNWGMSTTLYMWGDVNDLNGGWPGMTVGGTATFGDYTYLYYDFGKDNIGLKESLIFSNNGSSQLGDFPGGDAFWTIEEDLYLYIGANGVEIIADPEHPGDLEWFDPDATPVVVEEAVINLWFYDATDSLSIANIYAWGTSEIFGGWPGKAFASMDSISLLGLPLIHTAINCNIGNEYNLIINDGNGSQLPDYNVKATDAINDFYLKITDSIVSPLQTVAKTPVK